jgi:hypothetical protein
MSTASLLDELASQLRPLRPSLERLAAQLRDTHRQEEAEARYATWTLGDIVEPALRALALIEEAANKGRSPRDTEVHAAISFFDHLWRFASERQFPRDINVEEFLALISPAGSAASRLLYRIDGR